MTAAGTADAAIPLTPAKKPRCSATVRSSQRTSCCGHTPMLVRMAAMSEAMLAPLTKASPADGGTSPVSMEMVVVLPAPLWPSRPKIWPSNMSRSTPATAVCTPSGVGKVFVSPRSAMHRPSVASSRSAGPGASTASPVARPSRSSVSVHAAEEPGAAGSSDALSTPPPARAPLPRRTAPPPPVPLDLPPRQ